MRIKEKIVPIAACLATVLALSLTPPSAWANDPGDDTPSATQGGADQQGAEGDAPLTISLDWMPTDDGERPESVNVTLLADGVDTGLNVDLSAENNWLHTWDAVPRTYTTQEVVTGDGGEEHTEEVTKTIAYSARVNTTSANRTYQVVSAADNGITGWLITITSLYTESGDDDPAPADDPIVPDGGATAPHRFYIVWKGPARDNLYLALKANGDEIATIKAGLEWDSHTREDHLAVSALDVADGYDLSDIALTVASSAADVTGASAAYQERLATLADDPIDNLWVIQATLPRRTGDDEPIAYEIVREPLNDLRVATDGTNPVENGGTIDEQIVVAYPCTGFRFVKVWDTTNAEMPASGSVEFEVLAGDTRAFTVTYDIASKQGTVSDVDGSFVDDDVMALCDKTDGAGVVNASEGTIAPISGPSGTSWVYPGAEAFEGMPYWNLNTGTIPKFDANGEEIQWAIGEIAGDLWDAETDDYTANPDLAKPNTEGKGVSAVAINHLKEREEVVETRAFEAVKVWDDRADNGERPESVAFRLLADDEMVGTITVPEAGEDREECGFEPVDADGPYAAARAVKRLPKKDVDDMDAYLDGQYAANLILQDADVDLTQYNGCDVWSVLVTGLPVDRDGETISYRLDEVVPMGYERETYVNQRPWADYGKDTADQIVLNHRKIADIASFPIHKFWNDADNADGSRPASVTFHLLADGKEVEKVTLTADDAVSKRDVETTLLPRTTSAKENAPEDDSEPSPIEKEYDAWVASLDDTPDPNHWAKMFEGLPYRNDEGEVIEYEVVEDAVAGYELAAMIHNSYGWQAHNQHQPLTRHIVKKQWDDKGYESGRPSEITVDLLADGKKVSEHKVAAADGWKTEIENLPMFNDEGAKITYTATEHTVQNYTVSYSRTDDNTTTITNKVIVKTVEKKQDLVPTGAMSAVEALAATSTLSALGLAITSRRKA